MKQNQLGQKQKKIISRTPEEFIDQRFFEIRFTINGKQFRKAVDGLLQFEKEELDSLSDSALDSALQDCSYYRYTFLAAGAEIETKMAAVNREFNMWLADRTEDVKKDIITERFRLKKEDGVPASWFGSITKQEMENAIITHPHFGPKWEEYSAQLAEMAKMIKKVFGLRDILQDRGGHLQSIGRRRLENRKMSFGVSG